MEKFHIKKDLQQFDPIESSLKTFFLGPQAENQDLVKGLIDSIFEDWFRWRENYHPEDGNAITDFDKDLPEYQAQVEVFKVYLNQIMARFNQEIPTFSPRYIGHMLTDISLPALMGHIITLLHNPNNITGEASRVGIKIEDEAISDLAAMLGYDTQSSVGHFTSGGTVANFEGVLRARMRMSMWLTLGALAKTKGKEISLFESGHLGWEKYQAWYDELDVNEKTLEPYHLLNNNPYKIARKLSSIFSEEYEGPVILVPDNKHYSWEKAVKLIGLGKDSFWPVRLDEKGKLDVIHLQERIEEAKIKARPVLMVVSVAGTTEMGDFDPIHEVNHLLEVYKYQGIHIWHHVDAAYGGFFCSLEKEDNPYISSFMKKALKGISSANTITIDPHKLGYVPYSSGAFLVKSKQEYYLNEVLAPYIDFNFMEDKGPQTIEGSRSAAGAVSTWLTSKIVGLNPDGYGKLLKRTIRARIYLEKLLDKASEYIYIAPHSETNICLFTVARPFEPLSITNKRTLQLYEKYSSKEDRSFFMSKTRLGFKAYQSYLKPVIEKWNGQVDDDGIVFIRLTLMNPFFTTQDAEIDYPTAFVDDLKVVLNDLI